jgi:hypothetical protein
MSAATSEQVRASYLIRQSPIPALRRLSVNESETTIELQGTVGTYYLKQLAQELVKPLLGGRQLVNSVSVMRH